MKHDFCNVGLCLSCPRKDFGGRSWRHIRSEYKKTKKIPKQCREKPRTATYDYRKENGPPSKHYKPKERTEETRRKERLNRKNNIYHRVGNNLRSRLRMSLKHHGTTKKNRTINYIGCSKESLKEHLQSKFKEGMTWDNYGVDGWHIDHIRPLCSFTLSSEEEIHRAMHYTNLQPLWAKENRVKNKKWIN